ncbi:molybdopterin-dependent oxidoreductase [Flagellimonas olearia]|uniref:Molybdopterin-dependent oxidoreductase n=1 Tax=Flagellimonas olearia TaxID=552546 RepID=A0A6I1DU24_9FLAO|nr:molybdopterin cofactor-binding domain-containing protein [Allomuricauda olearia]KAB7528148.1 molybdopterin-dependent oxidoreductase [Allomuricauda olearia]
MERRFFLKSTSFGAGGLLISSFIGFMGCETEPVEPWEPNFFLRIMPDGTVEFSCPQSEIGQGTSTGLTQILADELGADWDKIKIQLADGSYEKFPGTQGTGGSNGIRKLWEPLRKAAAMAREMLILAASKKWDVLPVDCYAKDGFVHSTKTQLKIAFEELLSLVKDEYPSEDIAYKKESDYQYIGKSISGHKNKKIVTGSLEYSMDVTLPNMVYARIVRCPVFGGVVKHFNADAVEKMPGVIKIVQIEPIPVFENDFVGGVRSGIAVLADSSWRAIKASELLEITWDYGANASLDENAIFKEFEKNEKAVNPIDGGAFSDFPNALIEETISARYTIPYQANACMEPLNSVAFHKGYEVEVWAGTQSPQMTRERIAELTGLPLASVIIHNKFAGGGFGRRFFTDFVEEAIILSGKVRRPVKLIWTREDTISASKYHPYTVEYWSAHLGKNNTFLGFSNRGYFTRASNYPSYLYGKPIRFHESIQNSAKQLLPRASWRSVMAYPWGFGMESFMDEVAHKLGKDPLAFRLELLGEADVSSLNRNPESPYQLDARRLRKTLETASQKSGYTKTTKEGRAFGVSAIMYNYSYCAHIAEVSVNEGQLKVHKFTSVVDCGKVINPSQVKSQIEGSIVWGLTALLKGCITLKEGRVQQSNFHDYPLLRYSETPEIEVHLIASDHMPTGVGEPGVPGVAPAVLNAIHNATGIRLRDAPVLEIPSTLEAQG